ncbi:hypothetical protein F2Q70_00040724, partial [Brassica cretica]
QETAKKIGRDNKGLLSEARGPLHKAKRKSLKLASQEMKKAVMPTACLVIETISREAARKYREKKKARTAYLEDEVKRLQSLNEYLLRKLQSQAMVETKIIKLRALLVEMQVKIDDELGGFSFQKQCNGLLHS